MGAGYCSRNICISTNTTCNLKCAYCYEKDRSNKVFNVDEAVSIIRGILKTKTAYGTKIKLHGGEPFLEFTKIQYLCEHIWQERFDEQYHFHITTNGTLVHGDIQDWLFKHKNNIILKLSLDGSKKSHDINRCNSFDLIDIPFFVHNWPDLRVNMTITPQTVSYFSGNVKFLHSIGINTIIVNFALMVDWSQCKLERIFFYQLLELAEFYLANPNIVPINFFSIDIGRTINKTTFFSPCNIGQKNAYDFETKQYYPCHMFFPSVCGHQLHDRLMSIDFTNRESLESEYCLNCPFINICRTCYAENYIVRGSISNRDKALCIFQKLIYVALFKFEYARILSLKTPTYSDILKMQAIQKWQSVIKNIEANYIR